MRLFGVALMLSAALTRPALADELDQPVAFRVRSESLENALIDVSKQAKFQIVIPSGLVPARAASALEGTMSLKEALMSLLQGTPITYKRVGARTISIVPADPPPTSETPGPDSPEDRMVNAADESAAHEPIDAYALQEVIVTAQKRAQDLQQVPIAATALGTETLLLKNVSSATDLAFLAPSLKIETDFGNTSPEITLRGVGSGSFNQNTESTVALYMDEFVLNPTSSKLGQLFDLERVEVLRGPQGTLYGKNSTGGAINYVTRRPDQTTEADGSLTAARFGEYDISLGAQTPVNDDLSVRVALRRRGSDGTAYNPLLDQRWLSLNDWAGRMGVRYRTDWIDVYLKFFYDSSRETGTYNVATGVNFDDTPRADNTNALTGYRYPTNIDICPCQPQHSDVSNRGGSMNIDVPIGTSTFTSITGYVDSRSQVAEDVDWSPFPEVATGPYDSRAREFTQELRLASPSTNRLSWIAGVSYFYQDQSIFDTFDLTFLGLPLVSNDIHERTNSFAGFADGTFQVSESLSAFGGIRVTNDRKQYHSQSAFSLVGPFDYRDRHSWTEPTYRVGLNAQLTSETLTYVSFNRGYRSGEYDTGFISTTEQFQPVNPEHVNNYEAGLKTTAFDRRIRLAADVFYTQFKDQQLLVQRSEPGSICCSLVNAGRSRIFGFETEGVARLTPNLDASFQATYLNGKYQEFSSGGQSFAGEALSGVPQYQIRIGPEYRVPLQAGDVFIAPEAQLTGKARASTSIDPFGRDVQPAYTLINGQLGFRDRAGKYTVFLFVKNATNRRYLTDYLSFAAEGFNQQYYSAPMTWGLTVSGKL